MNRIGGVKCLRQLVYLCVYIGEDVFVYELEEMAGFSVDYCFLFHLLMLKKQVIIKLVCAKVLQK